MPGILAANQACMYPIQFIPSGNREVGLTAGPSGPYAAFQAVLARDAQDSLVAVELVLAQPTISSQLIDNLNASIHVRAVLTDLFLIDEILKGSQNQKS